MKIIDYFVRAPPTSTDNAVMRFDGPTGDLAQNGLSILSDNPNLNLPTSGASGSQVVVGQTGETITFAGITLRPHIILSQSTGTDPTMALVRDGTLNNSAPTFNFFRSTSGGVVAANNQLGIFSANGHDGTDYATAFQIEIFVDGAPGANIMPGGARFMVSPSGSSTPGTVFTLRADKDIQLAATAIITIPNTGLHLLDTDASHDLIVKPGTNLSADRTLTVTTPDADITLTLPLPLSELATQAANTVLANATGGAAVPTALAMGASTFLARLASGDIVAATVAQARALLLLPFVHCQSWANVALTGTATYLAGHATSGVGVITGRATHLTRLSATFACTASAAGTVRFRIYRNVAGDPNDTNLVFEMSQAVTAGTGYAISTTTILNGGTDALNGSTDYFTIVAIASAGTATIGFVNVRVEGTVD